MVFLQYHNICIFDCIRTMKNNSRDYILEKAAPVFNKHGFSGTSLAAICSATGMTKGSIYANFKDKDELGVAVFYYHVEQLNKKLDAILSIKDDPHEQLLLLLDFYQTAHKYPEFQYGCPVANAAPEADDTNPALKIAVNQVIEADLALFRKLIKKGIKQGHYKKKADPDFAFHMISALEGALLIAKTTGDQNYMSSCCDHLRSVVNGWLVKEGKD